MLSAETMLSPVFHTKRIERPPGLPGYCPAVWCAVCGSAANAKHAFTHCTVDGCPNVCHQRCLDEQDEFNCELTEAWRVKKGIIISITFRSEEPASTPGTNTPTTASNIATEEPDVIEVEISDDIDDLSPDELKAQLRSLRQEFSKVRSKLSNYECLAFNLPEKRDVLVQALNIVDALIATQTCQGTETRTISCSAIPSRIDHDWDSKVGESADARNWWNSGVPKKPKSIRVEETRPSHDQPPVTPPTIQANNQPVPEQHRQAPAHRQRSDRNQRPSNRNHQSFGNQQQRHNQHRPNNNWRSNNYHQNQSDYYEDQPYHYYNEERCNWCKRSDHTTESCPRRVSCDFCGRRYHTESQCREKRSQVLAEERQRQLISALRQQSSDTIAAIRHHTAQFSPFHPPLHHSVLVPSQSIQTQSSRHPEYTSGHASHSHAQPVFVPQHAHPGHPRSYPAQPNSSHAAQPQHQHH